MWPEYSPKQINVTDRATILNFIIGLNGYTVCTGIDNGDLNNEKMSPCRWTPTKRCWWLGHQ